MDVDAPLTIDLSPEALQQLACLAENAGLSVDELARGLLLAAVAELEQEASSA